MMYMHMSTCICMWKSQIWLTEERSSNRKNSLIRSPAYTICHCSLTTFRKQAAKQAASDHVKYSQEMSGQPPYPKRQGARGPRDQRTKGLEDRGTRGPRDQRTKGPEDQGTRGSRDQRTEGPEDQGTRGPRDQRTKGPEDRGTRGPRDQRPKGPKGRSWFLGF